MFYEIPYYLFIEYVRNRMKYYFYKTTNTENGKYYFGIHSSECPGKDNYCGSGTALKKAIEKYGRDKFTVEILKEFDSIEEAYDYERTHVTVEQVLDKNCYNIQPGGLGGFAGMIYIHRNHEMTKVFPEVLDQYLRNGWELGFDPEYLKRKHKVHLSEDHRNKISKALLGRPSPLRGTHISEEHKRKVSKARKGKSNTWALGVPRSEETKKKISEANKGPHPEWRRKLNSECHKGLPGSTLGKITVWHGGHKKFVSVEDYESFLNSGWYKTKKESLNCRTD